MGGYAIWLAETVCLPQVQLANAVKQLLKISKKISLSTLGIFDTHTINDDPDMF